MSEYLIFTYDFLVPGDFPQVRTPLNSVRYTLHMGRRVAAEYAAIDIRITKARPMPDYLSVGPFKVVSEKLRAILEHEGVNAEWLPINIRLGTKLLTSRHYLMNLLDAARGAMDREKSRFSEYSEAAGGGVKSISKLVLDESKLGDRPLVCLIDIGPFVVRRDVAGRIAGSDCVGVVFDEVEKYRD